MKQELSILIPIYNSDCREQVTKLSRQAEAIEGFAYEIIVADDGSSDAQCLMFNAQLSSLKNVHYIRREQNVGRAAIRNFLAQQAKYEWLLFMDGDMSIPTEDFLRKWLEADVVQVGYGGYIVGSGERNNLRYLYEKQCEPMHRAEERRKRPFMHFHTCNFMIAKEIMLNNPFDLISLSILPICYLQLGDSTQYRNWDYKLHGILDAIQSSGDGETAETAYHVINIQHEYEIFNRLGLDLEQVEVVNPQTDFIRAKTNQENIKGVYFNFGACSNIYREKYK